MRVGRKDDEQTCGPTQVGPRLVQSACHLGSLTLVKMIWISDEPINKFGDVDMHFESLGT